MQDNTPFQLQGSMSLQQVGESLQVTDKREEDSTLLVKIQQPIACLEHIYFTQLTTAAVPVALVIAGLLQQDPLHHHHHNYYPTSPAPPLFDLNRRYSSMQTVYPVYSSLWLNCFVSVSVRACMCVSMCRAA